MGLCCDWASFHQHSSLNIVICGFYSKLLDKTNKKASFKQQLEPLHDLLLILRQFLPWSVRCAWPLVHLVAYGVWMWCYCLGSRADATVSGEQRTAFRKVSVWCFQTSPDCHGGSSVKCSSKLKSKTAAHIHQMSTPRLSGRFLIVYICEADLQAQRITPLTVMRANTGDVDSAPQSKVKEEDKNEPWTLHRGRKNGFGCLHPACCELSQHKKAGDEVRQQFCFS